MGRSANWFIGMLFSRGAIYAYSAGSGITTVLFYIGYLRQLVTIENRVLEGVPVFVELLAHVAVPIWAPPITEGNILAFLLNCTFGMFILMYWTAKYDRATATRRRGLWR